MLMVTLRKPELKKVAAVCAGAVLCAAAALAVNQFAGDAVPAAAEPTVQVTDLASLTTYLSGFGLEVDPNSASVDNVKIPRKWDESFTLFNDVIKEAGLDLKSARGKQTEKWTVLIPAKSTESEKVYAVVITYKDTPVGAYFLERPSGEVTALVRETGGDAPSGAPSSAAETAAPADAGVAAETGAAAEVTTPETAETAAPADTVETGAYPTE